MQEDEVDCGEFDEQEDLHNFGNLDPIPIGARALCGTVSKRLGAGEQQPPRMECCPICLALSECKQAEDGEERA